MIPRSLASFAFLALFSSSLVAQEPKFQSKVINTQTPGHAIEIDIGSNIFTVGQAYTALSRARSLKSVRVVDVAARSFCTSEDVIAFFGNGLRVSDSMKSN